MSKERERIERVDARTDNLQVIIDAAQHEAVKRERVRVRRIVKKEMNNGAYVSTDYKRIQRDVCLALLSALRGKGTR